VSDEEPEAPNEDPANKDAPTSDDDAPLLDPGPADADVESPSAATEPNAETQTPAECESTEPVDEADEPIPSDEPNDVPADGLVHPDAPFCPGLEQGAASFCVDDADCAEGLQCFFENSPRTCNLGCAGPMDQCGDDVPCPEGMLCTGTPALEVLDGCACAGGTYCVAPCTGDDDCGTGTSCQPDGLCQSISCDDGYACAGWQVCDPDAPDGDDHGCRVLRCSEPDHPGCGVNWVCDPEATGNGCVRTSCTVGADCECGACSPHGSQCVSRPGVCAQ
jgi:hypothetical protein